MIDFLARITTGKNLVKERFIEWLKDNISEFNKDLANKFYEDFRCGLIHEGRIKNCGQFSYEINDLFLLENEVMVVNPKLLLDKIRKAFNTYVQKIRGMLKFFKNLRKL